MTSSLLGALGLVCLVFGLIHFLLLLFGASSMLWVTANLGIGSVLLVVAALMNLDALRERMSSGEARRAGKYGTSAILGTAFTLVILGLGGFLSTRYHHRFDWSEAGVHSLSDQSQKLLAGLDQDVDVVAFYSPLDMAPVREVLDRYAYESPRFKVLYVDPNERPELLAKYAIDPQKLGQGLVRIGFGSESVEVDQPTEEKVTNALVKLSRTGEKKVYFVEGHAERGIEGPGGSEKTGFERAADALRNENYRVEKLLLASQPDVPADADVVVIAGPTRPWLESERAALRRYLERGGSALVMLDPRAQTDLVEDVRSWGVNLGDDIVVDRKLALFGRATTPFAGSYAPGHEITKDLRETTIFSDVRSVRAGDGPASLTEIVFTGEDSWAETDLATFFNDGRAELADGDLAGPVPVAVAGTLALGDAAAAASAAPPEGGAAAPGDGGKAAPKPARIVVFGDSDFASNEMIEAYRNRDLFVNGVNWLMGDVEAISIRPVRSRASRFQLSQEQFQTIAAISLLVFPQALAVVGVLVWARRRSAKA